MLSGTSDGVKNDLWSVIDSIDETPEKRAAAAMVLAPAIDDEGRARLRVLSSNTALPQLRVAFEAAAQGDDGAWEEVIEKMARRA